jgi:hypothetical protein
MLIYNSNYIIWGLDYDPVGVKRYKVTKGIFDSVYNPVKLYNLNDCQTD